MLFAVKYRLKYGHQKSKMVDQSNGRGKMCKMIVWQSRIKET